MAKAEEFREEITSKIIEALEAGTAPWQQPWNGAEAPRNLITKHEYSGINSVILSLAAAKFDSKDPRWATYRQIEEHGQQRNGAGDDQCQFEGDGEGGNGSQGGQRWHVKKGSKGTHVILWKPSMKTSDDGTTKITSVVQRIFTVFHASQIEGIPEYVPPEINKFEAHEKAERIIADSGADIRFGGYEAFYKPSGDYIQMPVKEDFKSAEGYYSTFLHELCHWSGSEKRLNRVQRCSRFSTDYAFEELVAEIGSMFIASSAGIPQSETEFQNHASYIESWLNGLRSDTNYIFRAAAEASKAANYLLKRDASINYIFHSYLSPFILSHLLLPKSSNHFFYPYTWRKSRATINVHTINAKNEYIIKNPNYNFDHYNTNISAS